MIIYDNRDGEYASVAELRVGDLFEYDGYYCLLVDVTKGKYNIATYFNLSTNCLGTVTSDLINKKIIKPIHDADLVLRG